MCGIGEAMLAFRVLSTVSKFQQEKAVARSIERQQDAARRAAIVGYQRDMEQIEGERDDVRREEALENFKVNTARRKAEAAAINQGFGNPLKVIQDLGYAYDVEGLEIDAAVERDFNTLNRQQDQAYASLTQTFSGLTPPTKPSLGAAAVDIGTAVGTYLTIPSGDRKFLTGMGKQTSATGIQGAQQGAR